MARPLKKLSVDQIALQMQRRRSHNNRLWMQLFRIAAKTSKGKKIIRQITKTDLDITKWMQRI